MRMISTRASNALDHVTYILWRAKQAHHVMGRIFGFCGRGVDGGTGQGVLIMLYDVWIFPFFPLPGLLLLAFIYCRDSMINHAMRIESNRDFY